jgi:TPP-dependent pyruvate/acetoin dehydrogenase alpha subunit
MEAGAVGVVSALGRDDLVIGHYRSHGHALSAGVPASKVIAEILARSGGCCGGRGGTKHLLDVSRNYLGAYAIVGQQVALATGLGLALKLAAQRGERTPSIVACFFGDGASNNGTTFEALNHASIYSLPCLFICENNLYAVSGDSREMVGGGSISERAAGFGIHADKVDGMNVEAVWEAAAQARQAILSEGQPVFLELKTYRYRGHSVFQVEDQYRDAAEVAEWRLRDPIGHAEEKLIAAGVTREHLDTDRAAIAAELEADIEWARSQPVLDGVTEADMFATEITGLNTWGGF